MALGVSGAAIDNRLRNTANITLNGGQLVLIGGANAVNEIVGSLTLGANSGTSSITQVGNAAQATSLTFSGITRNGGTFLDLAGYGQDLGTANNRIMFLDKTGLTLTGTNPIVPYATLAKSGDIDFATYDDIFGVTKAVTSENIFAAGGEREDHCQQPACRPRAAGNDQRAAHSRQRG